ncbi:hypothetical protein [Actinokineospora sp. NBRC 105648]|uniref:hypothetical protein n=1 Tax=Actinokineospora sp. NBRC 105648 TaxID=3032206 RepID=UPI0024A3FB96|nr:hypothetical protein [Actinokineospora sp. NBRC 105648]GLZ41465.1 hypothetical protein Acsp05_50890 [Actinokineospora sp. NBRC 105648]
MSRVQAVLLGCVAVVAVAGCAKPTTGSPVAVSLTSTTSAGKVDQGSVTWMNRFCGMAKLLVTAGDTAQAPITSSDPAVIKRQFVETTGRLTGVLDAVLSDLRALRPAPAPEIDPVLGELIDNLSEARDAIATAKSDVEASEPITVDVLTAAVDRLSTAMRGFNSALKTMKALELPEELKDAGASARNCSDSAPAPTTTR